MLEDYEMSFRDEWKATPYDPLSPLNYRSNLHIEPLSTKREKARKQSRLFGVAPKPQCLSRTDPQLRIKSKFVTSSARQVSFKTNGDDSSQRHIGNFCKSTPLTSDFYNPHSGESYFEECFETRRTLGRGSFGEVVEARWKENGKLYAVKKMLEPFKSSSDRERKIREVRKHELLRPHPNIVTFFRAWEDRGRLFIQTELCARSLADYVREVQKVTEREAWNILYDLANALSYLHSSNIVHLDVKPDNIMLTYDMICKLGDFGLVLDLNNERVADSSEGDSKYLAAEVLNNPPTTAADIFSLGMTIFEVMTDADLPTEGECWAAIRRREIPDRFLNAMTRELRKLVLLMMHPEPLARPTANQILNDRSVRKRLTAHRWHVKLSSVWSSASFYADSAYIFLCFFMMLLLGPLVKLIHEALRCFVRRPREDAASEATMRTPEQNRPLVFGSYGYDSSQSDDEIGERLASYSPSTAAREFILLTAAARSAGPRLQFAISPSSPTPFPRARISARILALSPPLHRNEDATHEKSPLSRGVLRKLRLFDSDNDEEAHDSTSSSSATPPSPALHENSGQLTPTPVQPPPFYSMSAALPVHPRVFESPTRCAAEGLHFMTEPRLGLRHRIYRCPLPRLHFDDSDSDQCTELSQSTCPRKEKKNVEEALGGAAGDSLAIPSAESNS